MNWSDIGKKIGGIAPLLGGAVGGPGGSAIGSMVASVLGVENTPEAIDEAIRNDPDAAIKLKQLQNEEAESLRASAFKTLDAELKDKQNAREQHKGHPMPAVICVALTVMVSGVIYALFKDAVPPENQDLAYIILGALVAKWGDSIAYWVGTTRSSSDKSRQIEGLSRR